MGGPSTLSRGPSKATAGGSKQPKRPRADTSNGANTQEQDEDASYETSPPDAPTDITSPDNDTKSAGVGSPNVPTASSLTNSNFRNVSACNRCRLRKNRCDQRLPACAACEKAGVKCVGFDPITKKEIPRSYVYFLENRVAYLEALLRSHELGFDPPEGFAQTTVFKQAASRADVGSQGDAAQARQTAGQGRSKGTVDREVKEEERLNNLVSHTSQVAVQGTSDSRFLGSTAGISFARVVFAAVKSSLSGAPSERGGARVTKPLAPGSTSTPTMRDSFFGLDKKPTFKPAPFPNQALGRRLVDLYFEHANPQIPILHRPEFMAMFQRVYTSEKPTKRELYMLNIVFAIGAGTIVGKEPEKHRDGRPHSPGPDNEQAPGAKRRRVEEDQRPPEEYHASAMEHLGDFLAASSSVDRPFELNGALEELQAVLLLSSFALLRPVAPGLWYIIGVAVRLAIDLGLHQEDLPDADGSASRRSSNVNGANPATNGASSMARSIGRRQYVRDFRRRLWWCVYSFDRLVSTVVGRPFGVTDIVVTTDFPSILDDKFITTAGFRQPSFEEAKPSYKFVSYHYFRLRLLQSEIVQVLQHRQAQMARQRGVNCDNPYMHTGLQSPFLKDHGNSFRNWRHDIDRRLLEWRNSAPTQADAGVQFSPLFLELNYWQAIIMLYRQSLTVPPTLADDLRRVKDDVHSPTVINQEELEDEDQVFLKVAEAGQKTLKIYRQLHRLYLVNYTFLATHHLFMAGISFLYAIWHSTLVRSHLTLDDVDFTVLAATSVLDDLIEKCPPAEACRDAFVRMSKATIKMALSTTGFGEAAATYMQREAKRAYAKRMRETESMDTSELPVDPALTSGFEANKAALKASQDDPGDHDRKRASQFDLDFRDLFGNGISRQGQVNATSTWLQQQQHQQQQQQQPQQQRQQQLQNLAMSPPPTTSDRVSTSRHAHSQSLSSSMAPMNLNNQRMEIPMTLNRSSSALLSPPPASPASTFSIGRQPRSILNPSGDYITAGSSISQVGSGGPYSPYISQVHAQYPGPDRFADLDFLESMDFKAHNLSTSAGSGNVAAGQAAAENAQSNWDIDFGMNIGMGWSGSLPFFGQDLGQVDVGDAADRSDDDGFGNIEMSDAKAGLTGSSLPATTPTGLPAGSNYFATQHGEASGFAGSDGVQGVDLFDGFFFGGVG